MTFQQNRSFTFKNGMRDSASSDAMLKIWTTGNKAISNNTPPPPPPPDKVPPAAAAVCVM